MIRIDGSHGEGGGQMLRTALVLSLATQKPFHMHSIRAGRDKPGLKPQHLHILHALTRLSKSEARGAREGSSEVTFIPAPVVGGTIGVDVGTAGSITLFLQSVLPAILMGQGPCDIEIVGGTDVRWSPSFDYFREVLLPRLPGVEIELGRRAFYPRGGGRVRVRSTPHAIPPIHLAARPRLRRILIRSTASQDLSAAEVSERQAQSARKVLSSYRAEMDVKHEYADTFSTGSVIAAIAEFENGVRLGADALGERGKRAELVGQEAAESLVEEIRSDAPVDRHAADQWVLLMGLSGGEILASEITDHTTTNIWTCEQFLGPVFRQEGNRISSIR